MIIFITEPQNGFEGISGGPNILLNHSHIKPVVQAGIQITFEYLHDLSGQPVPVLRHPNREKVFSDVQRESPVFQFLSIDCSPVTGHYLKEAGSIFCTLLHPIIYLYTLVRSSSYI